MSATKKAGETRIPGTENGREAMDAMDAFMRNSFKTFGGYDQWLSAGRENVEAVVKAGKAFAKGVQEINQAVFGLAQESVQDGVETTKAMLACRTLDDVVNLQAKAATVGLDRWLTEGRKISEMSLKVVEESVAPVAERVNHAMDRMGRPAA